MTVTLEPVKIFISHRNSVIASASQHLHPEGPSALGATDNSTTSQSTLLTGIIKAVYSFWSSLAYGGTPVSSHPETELLFETKYGLRLEICRRSNNYLIEICDSSPNAKPSPDLSEDTTIESTSPSVPKSVGAYQTGRRYRYRIFPDSHTSFIWYDPDPEWLKDHDCTVEEETVESRYPALAPFFFAWRDVYETEFERQECHLGSHAEVFPDVRARVAWETEGIFMSCWLALQNEVESVEYSPRPKSYRIEKDTIGLELQKFLGDMESLLEMSE